MANQPFKSAQDFVRQVLREDLHQKATPEVVRDVALKVAKALPPPKPQKPAARTGKHG